MARPLVIPTIEVIGIKGKIIINQSDLAIWKEKGYCLLSEYRPPKEVPPTSSHLSPDMTIDINNLPKHKPTIVFRKPVVK